MKRKKSVLDIRNQERRIRDAEVQRYLDVATTSHPRYDDRGYVDSGRKRESRAREIANRYIKNITERTKLGAAGYEASKRGGAFSPNTDADRKAYERGINAKYAPSTYASRGGTKG